MSLETRKYKVVLVSLVAMLFLPLVWGVGAMPTVAAQRPSPTPTVTATVPPIATPTSTPRTPPTATPVPRPTTAPAEPKSAPSPGRQEPLCIRGKVTNWGYKDEPLVNVSFTRSDGSMLTALTDVRGVYELYSIPDQVGLLNIEDSWPGHHMLTQDIVVRPDCKEVIEVWLGFYGGPNFPEMPVSVKMSLTPDKPAPGDPVTFGVEILNRMEGPITQVQLTDYLGPRLAFVGASGAGQAEYADGLLTVHLGSLAPGASAKVTIEARLDPDVSPDASLINRASLLYRESVAVQASVEINLGGESQAAEAVTETSTEPAAHSGSVVAEESSEEHLPVTGVTSSPGLAIRLLGLGVLAVLVVFGWRRTRSK